MPPRAKRRPAIRKSVEKMMTKTSRLTAMALAYPNLTLLRACPKNYNLRD